MDGSMSPLRRDSDEPPKLGKRLLAGAAGHVMTLPSPRRGRSRRTLWLLLGLLLVLVSVAVYVLLIQS